MVLQACVIADSPQHRTNRTVLLTVVYCLCGVAAAYLPFVAFKIFAIVLGMMACMAVLARLMRDSLRQTGIPPTAKWQVVATVIVWPLYVVAWMAGPHCLALIDASTEDHVNLVLSMVLKTLNMHILWIPSERVVVWDLDSERYKTS